MTAQMTLTDVVTNNLANVNTVGFKKDLAVSKEFREMLIYRINDPSARGTMAESAATAVPIGMLGTGTMVDGIYTVHTRGDLRNTGNSLDVAIMGTGFFAVDTKNGIRYTRNGSFSLNSNKELVTSSGDQVLGQKGPIRLDGKKVLIDESGGVYSDGVLVDNLRISTFADLNVLEKEGAYSRTSMPVQEIIGEVQVQQGFLEGSNVNTISEMVNLINVYRTYEANQKMVQTQDETLSKAVNNVASI
jgi:flagellar basal-body rod protein FlgG